MPSRRLWSQVTDMSEQELRLQVVIPLLRATHGISNVTDVHGPNERGLDIVFTVSSEVEELTYGLQLKKGAIAGGGTGTGTVKEVVDQLQLANSYAHPVTTKAGTFQIDRFVIATSGNISATARDEITRRLGKIPVIFWDQNELMSRIHSTLPQLLEISDGETVNYLRQVRARYDVLDALDQVPGVAKRTLTQVFIEPNVRRTFDPTVTTSDTPGVARALFGALSLLKQAHNALLVGDQDSGKTTVLRMIALSHATALLEGSKEDSHIHCGVPVLVRAKDVLGNALSVRNGVAAEVCRLGGSALMHSLDSDLAAGNYFLLVDGFSEFAKEEDKELLGQLLHQFAEEYPRTRIVVSARTVDFLRPHYLQSFYQYQLVDFDAKQVGRLLDRWTTGSKTFADVGQKMVERLRDALQLPGSPIPATIGVMLHEEQNRFVTNTAEAIDRYMVIRLGRYAHELGMRQQVEWVRKQDMLAEVAYDMVDNEIDTLVEAEFVGRFNAILRRQGDDEVGDVAFRELVDSGVLVNDGVAFGFHRSSFKEFFAGHHIFRRLDLDEFTFAEFRKRKWGGAIVFAAGHKRANSSLLSRLAAEVQGRLDAAVGEPDDDALYSAFVLGRMLSNSDASDHADRVAALRTVLHACCASIPSFERIIVDQYGPIGKLMALIGAENSLFITLGVPWLRRQVLDIIDESETTEEERYLLTSMYAHLGFDDSYAILAKAAQRSTSLRVLVALDILVRQLVQVRTVAGGEEAARWELSKIIKRKLSGRGNDIRSMLKLKSRVLEVERQRMRRLFGGQR